MQLRSDLELLDRIGENHMTENWKAFQPTLQRTVMVCVLKPDVHAEPEATNAFLQGAKVAARISHPNVLGIYDAVEADGRCFIIQEYVPGTSLMERLLNGDPIKPTEAFAIAAEVAEGMHAAWDQEQLIHRNLTPRAILLDHDGTAKVSMIGQCRQVVDGMPTNTESEICGIPNYISPEQACGEPYIDMRADIYALGAILYHMLTGSLPFANLEPEEVLQAQLTGHLPWQAPHPPHLPAASTSILEHLLMRQPDNRPKNWHSVAKNLRKVALGHILIQKHSHEGDSTLKPQSKTTHKKRRRIVIKH